MTQEQVKKVRHSWKILCKMDPMLLEEVFYSKLFLDHPDMKSIFYRQGPLHYVNFINVLHRWTTMLDRLPDLNIEIHLLAFKLHHNKMRAADYPKVGHALIWTLKKALGDDFDSETEYAWQKYYEYVVEELITAISNRKLV